jgi:hypothetical protein
MRGAYNKRLNAINAKTKSTPTPSVYLAYCTFVFIFVEHFFWALLLKIKKKNRPHMGPLWTFTVPKSTQRHHQA